MKEVVYMKNKKRKKLFKMIFIKDLISALVVLTLIFLIIFVISKKDLQLTDIKIIIAEEIPVIKKFYNKNEFKPIKYLNFHSVLAESMPMINFDMPVSSGEQINSASSLSSYSNDERSVNDIPKNTYPIKTTQIISKNLEVRNETTYAPDFNHLLYSPLNFSEPEILIVHTHASESYKNDDLLYYYEEDSDRNTDIRFNVVKVGEELAKELKNHGFKVTHAKDINDFPSYNQSYNKTLSIIDYYLKNNKNIQIVLDIHRDSIIKSDGSKLKFLTKINDENVAQVMLVCGTNQAGLDNDTWQENLKFALKVQNYMETHYPGLARPLNLRQERFNTHATLGSMIIEIGTSGNTLDEALKSTKFIAKTLREILQPYRTIQ